MVYGMVRVKQNTAINIMCYFVPLLRWCQVLFLGFYIQFSKHNITLFVMFSFTWDLKFAIQYVPFCSFSLHCHFFPKVLRCSSVCWCTFQRLFETIIVSAGFDGLYTSVFALLVRYLCVPGPPQWRHHIVCAEWNESVQVSVFYISK